MRLDKWLWAARLFKTRSAAAQSARRGRVLVNGALAKPARLVRPGDRITLKVAPVAREFQVSALSARRGPATQAQALYEETEASRRAQLERAPKAPADGWQAPRRRPSKKDRRAIIRFIRSHSK